MSDAGDEALDLSKAPLLTHLMELRRRLLRVVAFCLVAFAVAYVFSEHIYAFLTQPLVEAFGEHQDRRMIYTGLQEAFVTHLKLSLFVAVFVAMPLILNQVWKFLVPGLYHHERRVMRPFLWCTPVLFTGGAALAFYGVFPLAWEFFVGFESIGGTVGGMPVELEARVSEYLSLVLQLIMVFGLSFELPLVVLLLARAGMVDVAGLRAFRKHMVIIVFGVAALVTPPDLVSQLALGLPVLGLYELSILIVRFWGRPVSDRGDAS